MEEWTRTTLSLCIFGLTRGFRPSESFKVPFLLGPWRQISKWELNNVIYPIAVYAYAVLLVVVFLLTDLLRYKPIIVLSGICGSTVYAILLWTESVAWLQVSQTFFGLFMATEIAYLTYMFAKVDPDKYAMVSSYTRASSLFGRFFSGVSGQLLTTFDVLDYRELNYISFCSQCLSVVWALMLPSVGFSLYFHQEKKIRKSEICVEAQAENDQSIRQMCSGAFSLVLKHAKMAYSNPGVVIWSLWYAGLTCCFAQLNSYIQLLWASIDSHNENIYNGAVEAALTLCGACGALAASRCSSRNVAAMLAAPLAALISAATLAASLTNNIFISYVCFVVGGVAYHFTITLSSTQIAQQLGDESCFGLVFGINTFTATVLQSMLTFTVINILQMNIINQYLVYGSLIASMAIIWLFGWLFSITKKFNKKEITKEEITKEELNNNNNHEIKIDS